VKAGDAKLWAYLPRTLAGHGRQAAEEHEVPWFFGIIRLAHHKPGIFYPDRLLQQQIETLKVFVVNQNSG
jgi:hypothetical protein